MANLTLKGGERGIYTVEYKGKTVGTIRKDAGNATEQMSKLIPQMGFDLKIIKEYNEVTEELAVLLQQVDVKL